MSTKDGLAIKARPSRRLRGDGRLADVMIVVIRNVAPQH